MANVVEMGDGFIHVTLDGAADFLWATALVTVGINVGSALATLFPEGIRIDAIDYYPPAAAAKGVVRNKIATGTIIPPRFHSVDGGPQVHYYAGTRYYKPCLVNADQTTPTATQWWFSYVN